MSFRHDTSHAEAVRLARRARVLKLKDPRRSRQAQAEALRLLGFMSPTGRP